MARFLHRLLCALARDRSGNTLVMVAAALVPLLAMVGGGIDMGRTYLVRSRLQQACDSGVLGARKELGAISNYNPARDAARVTDQGNRFFNANFRKGVYGTTGLDFAMGLEDDLSISGKAKVNVQASVMQMFGFGQIPLTVTCGAQLSVSNTDVMMALDVTGSMAETNPGDTLPKISVLKSVVKSFYATMEAGKAAGSRIRYGFVPYSTNVNVGALLNDSWAVRSWTYPSRVLVGSGTASGTYSYYSAVSPVSGGYGDSTSTYAATYNATSKSWSCPTRPADTLTSSTKLISTTSTAVTGPPAGTRTVATYNRTANGATYSVHLSDKTCTVTKTQYNSYVDTYQYITEPKLAGTSQWKYTDVTKDVSKWRTETSGCIEERATYEIDDYDNVDLSRALDLDIDLVPTSSLSDTQWRPQYASSIYERAMLWNGTGAFSTADISTSNEYIAPGMAGFAACPTAARKLASMASGDLATYIDSLKAAGSTYHDIGMIWAGRLLSPTGIFADDNKDVSGKATSRHLIFLTDGQTSSLDLSYGAYGVEPLAKRRWSAGSSLSLTATIESRFAFACEEVKKKNVTVWFVAFGTDLNPVMTECAGPGHYFAATNATELNTAFDRIARSIGDLRLSQ